MLTAAARWWRPGDGKQVSVMQMRHTLAGMRPDFEGTVEHFSQLAALVLDGHRLDVYPYNSSATLADRRGAAQFVRQHLDLLRLARVDLHSCNVLEAGSGLGFALLLCALLGAETAEGIDFRGETVQAVDGYLGSMPDDIVARVRVQQGDAAAMPYPDRAFDIVLSIEAISHYLDVPGFVAEAARVLKPGGVMIISDGNNGSNPLIRRRNKDVWEAFERGAAGTRVHGHTVGRSYQDRRAEAILSAFPELGEKATAIAKNTAGLTFPQTIEAARVFVRDGQMPDARYRRGQLAINPSGEALERLFTPRTLAHELKRYGFRVKAYGYWGGASGRWYLRAANRLLSALSPITLPTAPSFRIVARRP